MNTIAIIGIVYIALDVITSIAIYIILRIKGWTGFEMARFFFYAMRTPKESYAIVTVDGEGQEEYWGELDDVDWWDE